MLLVGLSCFFLFLKPYFQYIFHPRLRSTTLQTGRGLSILICMSDKDLASVNFYFEWKPWCERSLSYYSVFILNRWELNYESKLFSFNLIRIKYMIIKKFLDWNFWRVKICSKKKEYLYWLWRMNWLICTFLLWWLWIKNLKLSLEASHNQGFNTQVQTLVHKLLSQPAYKGSTLC